MQHPAESGQAEAVTVLCERPLLLRHERDQAFDIHPLVHLATRAWMEEQNQWDPWVGRHWYGCWSLCHLKTQPQEKPG